MATDSEHPANRIAADLAHLVSHVSLLPSLIKATREQDPALQMSNMAPALAQATGLKKNDVLRLIQTLTNLINITADEHNICDFVSRALGTEHPQLAEQISDHADVITASIADLKNDNPVTVTQKAQQLTYKRDKLFQNCEIITDARPVFDNKADKVLEFAITHTLAITVYVDDEHRTQYISLDNADVMLLREACDRAVIKSQTLKKALATVSKAEILNDEAL